MELTNELRWYDATNCAITVCDAQGIIVYMNDKAKETFAKHGDLIGHNLFDCHSAASQEKIKEMLATGHSNAYTIEKQGVKKMIYQPPWRVDGKICGMVEISMVIPDEMPHYIRR